MPSNKGATPRAPPAPQPASSRRRPRRRPKRSSSSSSMSTTRRRDSSAVSGLFYLFAIFCSYGHVESFVPVQPHQSGARAVVSQDGTMVLRTGRVFVLHDNLFTRQPLPSTSRRRTTGTLKQSRTELSYTPRDSLLSGISEISMGCSLGVLWSEYSILWTGCGPANFSDTLERLCYQGVILTAGLAIFNRIVLRQDLAAKSEEFVADRIISLLDSTTLQIRIAEYASLLSVIGAFIVLGVQFQSGAELDGLSGIDIDFCRAMRDM